MDEVHKILFDAPIQYLILNFLNLHFLFLSISTCPQFLTRFFLMLLTWARVLFGKNLSAICLLLQSAPYRKTIDLSSSLHLEPFFRPMYIFLFTTCSTVLFGKNFFQTRIRLRVKEREQWSSLISPYNFLGNVRKLLGEFRKCFFLVTTRDRESVLDILKLYDLQIIDSNIFAKNEYTVHNSKLNIIRDLIKKRKIEESVFIDDLEDHLVLCKTTQNLTTLQAKWGYVVPQKKEDNSRLLLKELERFVHGENVWI